MVLSHLFGNQCEKTNKQTNKPAICFTTKHMKMNCCSYPNAVNCMHSLILFFKIRLKVESLSRQSKIKTEKDGTDSKRNTTGSNVNMFVVCKRPASQAAVGGNRGERMRGKSLVATVASFIMATARL